jgi:Hint domain
MEQNSINAEWRRTRRNILSMGAVLVGLCGCKPNWENRHECRRTAGSCNSNGPQCYRQGTHILTTRGERRIEDLNIGDLVITVSGEPRPIKWIGRRRYGRGPLKKWPGDITPVRISRDTFGPNLPHTDLFLSQQHNLFVDGLFIRAVDLLGGTSIVIDPCDALDEIEYLHIKLATHDAIFAEGLPSETLRFNADSTRDFDNFAQFHGLYGPPDVEEAPYGPVCIVTSIGCRELLRSYLRSALSPWIDRRNKFEVLRDRLLDGDGRLSA